MKKTFILITVALAGVSIGFMVMRAWQDDGPTEPAAPRSDSAPEVNPVPPESAAADAPLSPNIPRPTGGSNISVVGGMSPEEMARLGIASPGQAPAGQLVPAEAGAAAGQPSAGTPVSAQFPEDVARAASRYVCLCGCEHRLHECPCNDQPVGAVTMLTSLQRLMQSESDEQSVDTGMVDRYGDRVLADR